MKVLFNRFMRAVKWGMTRADKKLQVDDLSSNLISSLIINMKRWREILRVSNKNPQNMLVRNVFSRRADRNRCQIHRSLDCFENLAIGREQGHFPLVLYGRPRRTGSGQFIWKSQGARVHFSLQTLQIPALWPTGAGELSGSDPWVGSFWTEPVLKTRAFH